MSLTLLSSSDLLYICLPFLNMMNTLSFLFSLFSWSIGVWSSQNHFSPGLHLNLFRSWRYLICARYGFFLFTLFLFTSPFFIFFFYPFSCSFFVFVVPFSCYLVDRCICIGYLCIVYIYRLLTCYIHVCLVCQVHLCNVWIN